MNNFEIRKYELKDYEEVFDMVVTGLASNSWSAYKNTLNGMKLVPIVIRSIIFLLTWHLIGSDLLIVIFAISYELFLYYVVINYYVSYGYIR